MKRKRREPFLKGTMKQPSNSTVQITHLPSNYMGDTHFVVIYYRSQVVCRKRVRLKKDRVGG